MNPLRWISRLIRSSLELPHAKLTEESAYDLFARAGSVSGVAVNEKTIFTASAVFRGVNLIATTVAKLPLLTYRNLDGGGKERDRAHPAWRLLRRQANAEQTAFQFKQTLVAHALVHRGGYAYIDRDGNDTPVQLILLDPSATCPVRENGRLWYVTWYSPEGPDGPRVPRKIHPVDVFHLRGLSWDGLTALSLLDVAKQSLGLTLAQQRYASIYFRNNAQPPIVLKHPKTLPPDKRRELREQWLSMQQGIDKAHLPALLENGLEITELKVSPQDAQLLESRKFSLVDVANWLGVPVHKVGGEGRSAYASLEQENAAFLDECLDAWLIAIEEEAWAKLLTEAEKVAESHTIEFLRQALVRANLAVRAAYYRTALGGRPWLSQNEVRALENLNPVEGGDDILEPLNMGRGGDQPAEEQARAATPPRTPQREKLTGLARTLLVDAYKRAGKRIGLHARRAARNSRTFLEFVAQLEQEHRDVVAQMLRPALQAAELATGRSIDQAAAVAEYFAGWRDSLTTCYDTASPAAFPAAVDQACITREMAEPSLAADLLTEDA